MPFVPINRPQEIQKLRDKKSDLQVVRRARLYETAPAHVENQPKFLNTAVAARTTLPPDQLLSALKAVEV